MSKEHDKKAQLLFNIRKIRNHYMIEPSDIEHIKKLTEAEKKIFMTKDVD